MCAVFVDVYPLDILGVNVACNVISLVDNKALLATLCCFKGKNRVDKICSDYQIIKL